MKVLTKVILFNKPYGVHSQFRKEHEQMPTLADYFQDKSLRVAGRLDKDSEGLLVLTDSGELNHLITTPPTAKNAKLGKKLAKTYLVQVENLPSLAQLEQLRTGVTLKDGKTLPAKVELLQDLPLSLWERQVPIRERKNIPTSWLSISIVEGKNRQVRRMTAAVGLPCLRLIRQRIGPWSLEGLQPGQSRLLQLSWSELEQMGLVVKSKPTRQGGKNNQGWQPPSITKPSKTQTAARRHRRHPG